MEMHHKLRRDPGWHPNGCNICGQIGHQAVNCPNGNTINWRATYGDDAFVLKPPQYWSEELKKRKAKQVDFKELEERARTFAKKTAESQGLDYEEIQKLAEELMNKDPSETIKRIEPETKAEEEPLPAGWAVAHDPTGRPYYWHKATQKTTWERPTADTVV